MNTNSYAIHIHPDLNIKRSIMSLPLDVINVISTELAATGSFDTLAALALASRSINRIAIPKMYCKLKMRDDNDYWILLDTIWYHSKCPGTRPNGSPDRPSPLQFTKHLTICHFPCVTLCQRIRALHLSLSPPFLLPSVETIEFTLSSCHSILWGPMQYLRFPISTSPLTHLLTAGEIIRSLSLLASPSSLCVHLNHYSVLDRDWNRFFSLLCLSWRATLREVNIHGLEHWLKAFIPGVKHCLFLDIENVPYRPGTGLILSQTEGAERERCIKVWAEVLLAMTADAMDREEAERAKGVEVGLTVWEIHCPGAGEEEIAESQEVLMGKLKTNIAEQMWTRLENVPPSEPFIHFITEEQIACPVCKECAPLTVPRSSVL